MTAMKVLHLISGGDTGGAKTHVHFLLKGLGKHIDVSMVCFMDGVFAQEAKALGIDVEVLPGSRIPSVLKRLEQKAREEKYDLIHCHGARGNLMGWLLKCRTGLPVVTTIHSDYKLDYMGRPLAQLTYGQANAFALRRLDYYIAVSQLLEDAFVEHGFPPDRIYQINNGLPFPPPAADKTREEFLSACGLQADQTSIIVGIAARLNPVKDISTLLRGFALAHARCPNLRLLIAGEGEQRKELESIADHLKVREWVCFAGWVSDVNSFYRAIDINALTSVSEGLPYSLVEGARTALPTVATRVGGVPTLIEHEVTGLLFQPGDVDTLARYLEELVKNPALRQKLGQQLYKKGEENFSLDGMVRRQIGIYNSILRREKLPGTTREGVTICGAYGRGNAGDDAILEAIITEMRNISPELTIRVLSRRPKATRMAYRVTTAYTFNVFRFHRFMRESALYINGGGSLMQDVTSRRSLWFYLYTISAAKRKGCKVMMYGCGIGPIRYQENRRLTSKILNRDVDVITLRDQHSGKELESMGITAPEVVLSADPTVILPSAPPETANSILERNGLDPTGHYIAFSVRPWNGFKSKTPVFGAAADYACQKYGLIPLFLPIEARLDTMAARQVAPFIRQAPFKILGECANSAETISLFARMEVVVSMRLHALVFAAGHGVPLVGVVYDRKVSSFLDAVGQDLYARLDDLDEKQLCAMIDEAVSRINDREFLSAGVERLRQIECQNIKQAKKLLFGGNA